MKSTELHPTVTTLGTVRWGSFDLVFEGTNTAGAWHRVTVRIEWALWRVLWNCARSAWLKEEAMRTREMDAIAETLPRIEPQAEERRAA